MPTELPRIAASSIRHYRGRKVSPLTLVAIAAFAMIHLVSGIMIERSHARAVIEPPTSAALDEVTPAACSNEARPPLPSAHYD